MDTSGRRRLLKLQESFVQQQHGVAMSIDEQKGYQVTDATEADIAGNEEKAVQGILQRDSLFDCIGKIKREHQHIYKSKFGSDMKIFQQTMLQRRTFQLINRDSQVTETRVFLSSIEPLWVLETPFSKSGIATMGFLSDILEGRVLWMVYNSGPKSYGRYRRQLSSMPNSWWASSNVINGNLQENSLFCLDQDGMLCSEENVLKEALLYGKDAYPFTKDQMRLCFTHVAASPPLEILMGNYFRKNQHLFGGKLVFLLYKEGGNKQEFSEDLIHSCEGKYVILQTMCHIHSTFGIESHQAYNPRWTVLPSEDYILFKARYRLVLRDSKRTVEESKVHQLASDIERKHIRMALLDESGNVVSQRGEEIVEMMFHRRRRKNDGQKVQQQQEPEPEQNERNVNIRFKDEMEDSLKSGKCTEFVKEFLKERDQRTAIDARHEHPLSLVPYKRAYRKKRKCIGCHSILPQNTCEEEGSYGVNWFTCKECSGIYFCPSCIGDKK